MVNRINLILQAKNITARQFAEEIGIQPSGMSHILGGRNNPSLDFVQKVLRRYPEIDANWLLLGRGEMYSAGGEGTAAGTMRPDAPAPTDVEKPEEAAASGSGVPKGSKPQAEPTLFNIIDDGAEAAEAAAAVASETDLPAAEPMRAVAADPEGGEAAPLEPQPAIPSALPAGAQAAKGESDGDNDRVVQVLMVYADKSFEVLRARRQ